MTLALAPASAALEVHVPTLRPSDDQLEAMARGRDRADLKEKDLDTLAEETRYHRDQAEVHHRWVLYHYLEQGRRIAEVRSRMQHGEFIPYVRDELNMSERHAQRLMHLSRNATRVSHLSPETPLRAALEDIQQQREEERRAEVEARRPVNIELDLPDCTIEVGDCIDLPLPDGMVDLIVTSPPYGLGIEYADTDDDEGFTTYMQHAFAWAREMYRVSDPSHGRICLNVPLDVTYGGTKPIYAAWVKALEDAGWQYRSTIVWNEGNVSRSTARGTDGPSAPHVIAPVEMIIVAYRGEWNLGRGVLVEEDREDHRLLTHDEWLSWTNGVWSFSGVHREDHPAPFPEELPRRLIKLFSYPDAVVLDPFVGSGTSAAVSRDLGRTFYGFDHSPRYVQGARARVLGMSL